MSMQLISIKWMCRWQSTNEKLAILPDLSAMLLVVVIILKILSHANMLFPITLPRPLCSTIF